MGDRAAAGEDDERAQDQDEQRQPAAGEPEREIEPSEGRGAPRGPGRVGGPPAPAPDEGNRHHQRSGDLDHGVIPIRRSS
jgi:hypothetical protein